MSPENNVQLHKQYVDGVTELVSRAENSHKDTMSVISQALRFLQGERMSMLGKYDSKEHPDLTKSGSPQGPIEDEEPAQDEG